MTLFARIEALIERLAAKPWADTADITEARALWEMMRGNNDAR